MWLVTDTVGKFRAIVNPTRGKANLAYQLKRAGFLGEGAELEGQGFNRRVTYGGRTIYFVVQLPRTMSEVVRPEDLIAWGGGELRERGALPSTAGPHQPLTSPAGPHTDRSPDIEQDLDALTRPS